MPGTIVCSAGFILENYELAIQYPAQIKTPLGNYDRCLKVMESRKCTYRTPDPEYKPKPCTAPDPPLRGAKGNEVQFFPARCRLENIHCPCSSTPYLVLA